jgi:hypothetical protein
MMILKFNFFAFSRKATPAVLAMSAAVACTGIF